MGKIGPFELIVIVAVIVLLFGGRKIPELMRGMGEGIRNFKEGIRDTTSSQPTTPAHHPAPPDDKVTH